MSQILAWFVAFLPRYSRFRYVLKSDGATYGQVHARFQLRMGPVIPILFPSSKFKPGSGHISPARATSLPTIMGQNVSPYLKVNEFILTSNNEIN